MKNEPKTVSEPPNDVLGHHDGDDDESDIDRRRTLLTMVVGDLQNEFIISRINDGESEDDAVTDSALDTTNALIEEAVHLLVHSTNFDGPETFVNILQMMLKAAIDSHRECITLMEPIADKLLNKNVS